MPRGQKKKTKKKTKKNTLPPCQEPISKDRKTPFYADFKIITLKRAEKKKNMSWDSNNAYNLCYMQNNV